MIIIANIFSRGLVWPGMKIAQQLPNNAQRHVEVEVVNRTRPAEDVGPQNTVAGR